MPTEAEALRELLRAADAPANPEAQPQPPVARYRSGRTLQLAEGVGADTLTVTSPQGQVELTVRFTAEGPVLSFSGAKVDLSHASELRLRADRISLQAREELELRSDGAVAVRGGDDVHVDGRNVLINCGDRPAVKLPSMRVEPDDEG